MLRQLLGYLNRDGSLHARSDAQAMFVNTPQILRVSTSSVPEANTQKCRVLRQRGPRNCFEPGPHHCSSGFAVTPKFLVKFRSFSSQFDSLSF